MRKIKTFIKKNPAFTVFFILAVLLVGTAVFAPLLAPYDPYEAVLADAVQSRGVQFVGLVSDTVGADGALDPEQVELAKEAVAETGASYRHLLPSEDLNGLLSQIYAVPTTFFVDSRGRQVGSTYMRAMSREEWEAVLDGILAELPDGEAGLEEN